ncbi:MAG: TAT-variant-translocated molybdopterin oxidoreductase [Bacteroidota bacterium]
MSENSKRYWRSTQELTNETGFVRNANEEFPGLSNPSHANNEAKGSGMELSSHRRDFLKVMGFSIAAASLAACEAPVKKAIPLLNKPEEYEPGVANWYASTYAEDGEYASILVKTREGRPIKIEGNTLSSITKGGTSTRIQASVLSLYDTERFRGPRAAGKNVQWAQADDEIAAKLKEISASNGAIRIVTGSLLSPASKQVIADFKAAYPSAQHVTYDTNSAFGLTKACKIAFGESFVPGYRFDKANIVVSFGADFLGTWISPAEFSKQWVSGRKVNKHNSNMSRLYSFEGTMSLTSANADHRNAIRPTEEGQYVAALYNAVAKLTGAATISVAAPANAKFIDEAAADLVHHKGTGLVVSGSNDFNIQLLVLAINNLVGNIGTTVGTEATSNMKQGDDEAMSAFVKELGAGSVSAAIFWGVNPVYDYPQGAALKGAISKLPLSVSFADRPDETAEACQFVCPDNHYLESWNDAEPLKGYYSLTQPVISPLFKTRQAQDSLLKWSSAKADFYTYLQEYWKAHMYPQQKVRDNFRDFWTYSLHDGIFEPKNADWRTHAAAAPAVTGHEADSHTEPSGLVHGETAAKSEAPASSAKGFSVDLGSVTSAISSSAKGSGFDLVLYESVGMGSGRSANNPWLQEFPDPISRSCWENFVSISMTTAKELGVVVDEGDTFLLNVTYNGVSMKLPALVQPGQNKNTISIAVGYGRSVAGKAGVNVGKNVFPWISTANGYASNLVTGVKLEKTGEEYKVAHVQTHHTIMGRDIIQEATLSDYKKDPSAGHVSHLISTPEGPKKATDFSLWNRHERPNHAWGMSIDLNACTGCGACVISCQAENNIPVVGKQEVLNRREMHWIRIDRYYSTNDVSALGVLDRPGALEIPSDDPEVVFQPLMCQHCNNAPCETVCPVAATTHSTEGLNQMTYNRCVGTRYCANNCPYKVRRFNWFSYPDNKDFAINPAQTDLGRMVLNPDVTVRARGVIEKCSMCVQRIQDGKLTAKRDNRRPKDGEIETACSQSCPADAIVFGDMNDPESRIAGIMETEYEMRSYRVLEEINTNPSVSYLTKIRNKAEKAHA